MTALTNTGLDSVTVEYEFGMLILPWKSFPAQHYRRAYLHNPTFKFSIENGFVANATAAQPIRAIDYVTHGAVARRIRRAFARHQSNAAQSTLYAYNASNRTTSRFESQTVCQSFSKVSLA